MPLPKEDSKEWKEEVDFYLSASSSDIRERGKELKMAPGSYQARMRERGILRDKSNYKTIEKEEEKNIINLPPIKLREYKSPHIDKGDEEIMIVHAGDGHAGKITKSFNKEVYQTRMEKLFDSVMIILGLHRHMYPITKLYIINTGDNIQGENPYQGSKIGEVEMGSRDQIKKIAVPVWNNFIGSLKQNFEEIIFEGFPGNHGYDKLSPETSRDDLLFYDILQQGIGQYKGITINIHDTFGDIVNIGGFRCFCFHGDEIPCSQGVPFFGINRKLKSWFIQFGGFNYSFGGHFHKTFSDEVASKLEHFTVSTLVSDDDWALKKLGISSKPSQSCFGIHPRKGITWRYSLIVDDKFLPEKE